MSYVAEPYAQFVDDLLTGLTGGHVRESFRMLEEETPFRLGTDSGVLPSSIRVYGQAALASGAREFHRFSLNTDFILKDGREIVWKARDDGTPVADARWPAEGTSFFVNYESSRSDGTGPLLTDRSTGSVTRLLAESVGREFAVLSGQLDKVYQAGFLATAGGRDLDNLVALVGLTRNGRNVAMGSVTFSRRTPAPADITIAAGTRLSTGDAPAVSFETTGVVTLQRGQFSVDAPVQALVSDSKGIVAAGSIVAINRPVLGIDSVSNPDATQFGSENESDDALRLRARRALESAGQATVGSLLGVLTSLPGLREKDIRFTEDPIKHPGIVNLDMALPALTREQTEDYKQRAMELLEENRPVGIRIRHNIEASRPPGPATPAAGQETTVLDAPIVTGSGVGDKLHMPVDVNVTLQPAALALTPSEREQMTRAGKQVVETFIADAGLGESLVYNRLIAQLMAIDGVLDVTCEMFPSAKPTSSRTRNILPDQTAARPVAGAVDVQLGNALVALDVTTRITFSDAGTIGNPESNASSAAADIRSDLQQALNTFNGTQIDPAVLLELIPGSDSYSADSVEYFVEYLDAGVRINKQDISIPLSGLERLWVRRVDVQGADGTLLGSSS